MTGYMIMGRTFAYLGVAPIFIGEVFIARELMVNRRRWLQRFIDDLFHLRLLATSVAAVMLWGLFEVLRAYYIGKVPIIDIFKTFTFNYYPIVLPIGVALGHELKISEFIRFWKRFSLAYGVLLLAYPFLQDYELPWNSAVPLFAGPPIPSVVPVSILALWPYLRDWKWKYPALILAMVPILVSPGRGALLGLALGLCCIAMISVQRVMVVSLVMGGLFLLATLIGPMFPAMAGRSAQNLDPIFGIARVVSTYDEVKAIRMLRDAGYADSADDMEISSQTAEWRKKLWRDALHSLNTPALQLLGHGHGADLTIYTPGGEDVRTPHNFVVFAVFYTGAVGLAFFGLMICVICYYGLAIPDRNFKALLFSIIGSVCLMALVGNMFETPFGAIPFYLLAGVLLGMNYRNPGQTTMPMIIVPAPLVAQPEMPVQPAARA